MATVFAVSSSIPQIIKSIKSKKTDDVSIWLVIVLNRTRFMGRLLKRNKLFSNTHIKLYFSKHKYNIINFEN